MVASGNWFLNVLYWYVKAFWVDPWLGLLGLLLGLFADW